MRKFIYLGFTMLLAFSVNAQNLTLDKAIALRTNNLAAVEEYLTANNWQLVRASEPAKNIRGLASFAFKKRAEDDMATWFVSYMYGLGPAAHNRILVQINNTEPYNIYMSRLKALGYVLQSSKIINGKIAKIYKGKNLTIRVQTGTQKNGEATVTTYHFLICDSADYAAQYGI